MTELRIGAALLLVILGGYIAVMNAGCLIFTIRNKKRGINKHHSTVPLLSLVIAWFAYLI
jgi:hypothetical protein